MSTLAHVTTDSQIGTVPHELGLAVEGVAIHQLNNLMIFRPNRTIATPTRRPFLQSNMDPQRLASNVIDTDDLNTRTDDVVATHNVDPALVFATGFSNGGHMSIRLAEEAADRIAGFAAISAADAADSECTSSPIPVPALFMSGSGDGLMPFEGGSMANGATVFGSAESVARWAERNGAVEESSVTFDDLDPDDGSTVTATFYAPMGDGAPVALYTIDGGGHSPPSASMQLTNERPIRGRQNHDIEMAEEVWRFLAAVG